MPAMLWHQYTKNQIETELKTSVLTGLSESEAKKRLLEQGPNLLPARPPESWLVIFARQFKSPLIYILVACSVIIFLLGEISDAIIIAVVLLVNAIIGTVQEGRAGKILENLKKLSSAEATVLREGREVIVPEAEVVLGDVLMLLEGQRVVADARVIFCNNLRLDESALTGESGPVPKRDAVLPEEKLHPGARHNMIFKGTAVLAGFGQAVVVGIGKNTEMGKISQALLLPEEEMPLQKNIKILSKWIIYFVFAMSAGLFFLGVYSNIPPREMFAVVVSLALSIIPEGLPVILTLILAHGVWRMSKKNALVKKLQAVEALGQANILAVDKTGTITENQMVVKELYVGRKIYQITGNGYEPKGQAYLGGALVLDNPDITMVATIAGLSGKATVQFMEQAEVYKISGDPTEAAMLVLAEKMGFSKEQLLLHYEETAEIPFESKNKHHAVFYNHEGRIFCAVSGAPEIILEHSTHVLENGASSALKAADHKQLSEVLEEFAGKGLRVVAFGYKYLPKSYALDNIDDLIFGGFLGIEDAIRPQARAAVLAAEEAGLKVVMITGDLRATAKAIAKEAGIFKAGDEVITGSQLSELAESSLAEKLDRVSVFARVMPEDKMQIIKAYKQAGHIIAMTGDGVNDAPSLVAADLGVAMGKIGTEVAKAAADIVLLDDNLQSIVTAIKEGRVMRANIKKALQFLFSTSLGELLTISISLLLRLPLPVTAVQILWLNLITDPLSGAALALEKEEGDVLDRREFGLGKFFVDAESLVHMAVIGLIMAAGAIYIFNLYYFSDPVKAQTMALTLLAVFQWYNSFNCRFSRQSIFHKRIFSNKYVWLALGVNFILQLLAVNSAWFNKFLKTAPLNLSDWLTVFALGFAVILADETRKWFLRRKKPSAAA